MRETLHRKLRPLTAVLLALFLLLLGSALLPASVVFAGDGYGSGTCGAETTRTCEATDSVLGAAAAELAASIVASGGLVPPDVVVVAGSDGVRARALSTDAAGQLNVNAAVTLTATQGAGNTDATTLRMTPGGDASATETCGTVTAGGADVVIAARAGRQHSWVQVGLDTDGPIRVAMAGTTNACANGEWVGSGTATTAGQQWIAPPGYSGDVAICSAAGTVSICYGEAVY